MTIRTKDGQEKQVDLTMAIADFMWVLRHTARHPEKGPPADEVFDYQFKRLELLIREWWGDYKKDPNRFLP